MSQDKQSSTSPGNPGSRGSRGQANSGAQEGNATERSEIERLRPQGTDLRGEEARGGGGASSASSRAQDPIQESSDEKGE